MTESKEYQAAGPFKRYLLRQIRAGKSLMGRGWPESDLPLDVHALKCVKDEYDRMKLAGQV